MKLHLLCFLLLIYFPIDSLAQHEADNWYFGKKSGLSFSGGAPVSLSDGQISTLEGCSAISDATTGALLFYTDGITVWNSNHTIMLNGTGLQGGFSATQSTLIIPNPANNLQYYLFTVSESESGDSALSYSLVSLETPGGEVLAKNTHLLDGVSEKLTGTKDCEGLGYWVVTHERQTGTFYAFHVTSNGIAMNPVISRYVPDISNFTGGYMKISPNRSKLALASTEKGGFLALFDFDPKTGVLSKYLRVNTPLKSNTFYGLSFSPDNTKLYASAIGVTNYVYQYEVNLPDSTSIRNSFTILNAGVFAGALQLAPDGKIYTTQNGGTYVGVIDQPNLKGTACGYRANVVALSGLSYLGLPNFMDYIFNVPSNIPNPLMKCLPPEARTQPDTGCVGASLVFTDLSTAYPTSREWTFENGTPSASTDSIVSVSFASPGIHQVRLIAHNENGSDTVFTHAVVYSIPTAIAGSDKKFCKQDQIQLGAPNDPTLTYSWLPVNGLDNPSKANPKATPMQSTTYILGVSNIAGCISFDTVSLTLDSIIPVVSQNTTICNGESTQLRPSRQAEMSYSWSPTTGLDDHTIPNPSASPKISTTYTVYISRGNCIDSGLVTIKVTDPPIAFAGKDQSICPGDKVIIGQPPVSGNIYMWSPTDGLSDPASSQTTATPLATTSYILKVVNADGCLSYDTVLLTVLPINTLAFTLLPDTISIIPGRQFQARIHIPKYSTDWQLRLGYDTRVVSYLNASQTNGISLSFPHETKNSLLLSGAGEDGDIMLNFMTYLPYTPDTVFSMKLSIDSATSTLCDSMTIIPSTGNVLFLDGICGKGFRAAEETGKSYFLTIKEHTVEFGIGLTGEVRLEVFDNLGTLVHKVVDNYLTAGIYSSEIDLPTGVYFWRIRAGMYQQVVSMVVVR
ncbi:MAG: PKD domain-containing protein [Ignavibacteria bacterium]|nr:PKD domain-containing protein [Ignavibacteria bacterium]